MSAPQQHKRANKTDAGNDSKAICRVSNVLRSPSPDPKRSIMKYFSLAIAIAFLPSCSGWVEHQHYTILKPPATLDSRKAIESTGFRLVRTEKDDSPEVASKVIFNRFRSPALTVSTFNDGSLVLLFWDSGVPPFEMHSPRFQDSVSSVLEALQKSGVEESQIITPQLSRFPKNNE